MIKIPNLISDTNKNAFLKDVKQRYIDFLNAMHLSKPTEYGSLYTFLSDPTTHQLDEAKVENLLTGDIDYLKNVITQLNNMGCNSSGMTEFTEKIYNRFASRKLGKAWAEKIGITTCPYCNRSYAFTVRSKSIRPEYDHYFPKSLYPYLCVSMYNLIPSCSVCNRLKSDIDTFDPLQAVLYPFTDEFGEEVVFVAKPKNAERSKIIGLNTELEIELKIVDKTNPLAMTQENSISKFALKELYDKHADYANDIRNKALIYTNKHLVGLLNAFPCAGTVQRIKDLAYLNYLSKDEWHKRILSKFTHDLVEQFKIE